MINRFFSDGLTGMFTKNKENTMTVKYINFSIQNVSYAEPGDFDHFSDYMTIRISVEDAEKLYKKLGESLRKLNK